MTKMCVRIAYGSETVEKSVKMGRVGFLPGVSRTQVKAHSHRQDPTYVGQLPCTQNLNNTPTYVRTELHMHEYKLRTQAQTHSYNNTYKSSSSTFSRKHHPKSILDMFLPLLRHQFFI